MKSEYDHVNLCNIPILCSFFKKKKMLEICCLYQPMLFLVIVQLYPSV